ncbi:hypothetical protein ScalyP_jg6028 [Parmales sp. scaly parma]|nr:hypothetical protein ScalyP_jg6028 [Parmales sp. scaly parma]|tara:strand:+ start:167 stop:886 length:720 start_codon:yes stop_codon:yes gene_type:complete
MKFAAVLLSSLVSINAFDAPDFTSVKHVAAQIFEDINSGDIDVKELKANDGPNWELPAQYSTTLYAQVYGSANGLNVTEVCNKFVSDTISGNSALQCLATLTTSTASVDSRPATTITKGGVKTEIQSFDATTNAVVCETSAADNVHHVEHLNALRGSVPIYVSTVFLGARLTDAYLLADGDSSQQKLLFFHAISNELVAMMINSSEQNTVAIYGAFVALEDVDQSLFDTPSHLTCTPKE